MKYDLPDLTTIQKQLYKNSSGLPKTYSLWFLPNLIRYFSKLLIVVGLLLPCFLCGQDANIPSFIAQPKIVNLPMDSFTAILVDTNRNISFEQAWEKWRGGVFMSYTAFEPVLPPKLLRGHYAYWTAMVIQNPLKDTINYLISLNLGTLWVKSRNKQLVKKQNALS